MKITTTGSLGHIGKPLVQELIQQRHEVTVVSSNGEKQIEIEALGARAAIGSMEDAAFLTKAFSGADAAFTMVPPNNYFDHSLDLVAYYKRLGNHYKTAILNAGVKRVVNLSTIGADLSERKGILLGAHYLALLRSIAYRRRQHITASFTGRKFRYVASEELTGAETAKILGQAIGKPQLEWVMISDAKMLEGLIGTGMNPEIAAGMVEMYSSLNSGLLGAGYFKHRREKLGKTKLVDFAQGFKALVDKD